MKFIDYTRDSLFSEQALKMIKEYYILPSENSPQDAFARAAVAYSYGDEEFAERIYDYASRHWFMFASPVLSNAQVEEGKWKSLPISCFLNYVPDTLEGLIDHTSETRWLSVKGGGVGGHWRDVRSVSKVSPGPIPFIKTMDADMSAYRQGKTRKGSYAAYLDVSHPDIEEFLSIRIPTGGDPNRKCFELHNAVNVTDRFMMASRQDLDWDLIDPYTKKVVSTVRARDLWERILETRFRTGEPYINFIDEANRHLPESQKKMGLEIHGSNLCFTGDTKVAVADGRDSVDIKTLSDSGEEFPVWSARKRVFKNQYGKTTEGDKWIPEIKRAIAKKTGTQEIINVILSDGTKIRCTEEHEIGIYNGSYIKAKDSIGAKLQRFHAQKVGAKYRSINSSSRIQHREIWKYYNGSYPKGFHVDHIENIADDKLCNLQLLEASEHRHKTAIEMSGMNNPSNRFDFSNNKKRIYSSSMERNGRYSGVSDVDMLTYGQDFISNAERISVPSWRFYAKKHGLPQSFSKNRFDGDFNKFIMIVEEKLSYEPPVVEKSHQTFNGFPPFEQYVEVVSIERDGTVADVYDLQVEDNHNFFIITTEEDRYGKGVLVHNCNEIHLATNNERTAVCCLSSLNLEKFDEWKDTEIVEDLIRLLDNVLQRFIDSCPDCLSKARFSAERERSLGLGAMGFHYLLQRKGIPFESALASSLNRKIFKLIQERAEKESRRLARVLGEPEDMRGTGLRNAHLTAVAPNANSAIIVSTSPSIEPIKSNAFSYRTRAGTHLVKNKYLEIVLEQMNMNNSEVWQSIILNMGSVQHLDFLSRDQKDVFKTAFELDQRWIIDHAGSRQPYISQGQSVNLFFPAGTPRSVVNQVHIMAWERKLKGLYYLRSSAEKSAEKVSMAAGESTSSLSSSSSECMSCHG